MRERTRERERERERERAYASVETTMVSARKGDDELSRILE